MGQNFSKRKKFLSRENTKKKFVVRENCLKQKKILR